VNRYRTIVLVAALAGALVLPAPLAAEAPRHVTIASGSVDGIYYPIAGAIARIVSDARDLNIRASVESSEGSVMNAQLIRSGEVDFALLQNDVAYYAFNGVTLDAFTRKPVKTMSGIFTVYPEVVQIVATKASGVRAVRDLKGKRVVFGLPGSGAEQNALQIIEAHGLHERDLGSTARLPATAAVDQLKAGLVDAAFFTTSLGSPVIADAFGSGRLTLVGVGTSGAETLQRKYPFYTIERVAANTYPGQELEVVSPGVMAMLVARSGLPEDLVYRFTKAVFESLPKLRAAHSAARSLTLQTALAGMALPLHPGAQRFFNEKGIAR